jgi:predicted nucleic acid-binding protein
MLPSRKQRRLLHDAASTGIAGGAIYDALIAATALHAGEVLATLDRRAIRRYEAFGARVRLLG